MRNGTKFLTSVLVMIFASFVVVTPLFGVEKVSATEGGSWTTLAPLPETTSDITGAAAVDGKIYCIGANMTLCYDTETNNWIKLTPSPIANNWGAVVACQNKIYLIGGSLECPTSVYDPVTDMWENGAAVPSTRIGPEANAVDGKIYVTGGSIPSALGTINPSGSNDVYDTETDSWSKMAPVPVPVAKCTSAVLDDKIYIISGIRRSAHDSHMTSLVQVFDPATNQWTNITSIPTAVIYAGACATTGVYAPKRIYVLGGQTYYYYRAYLQGNDFNQMYDPETDAWTNATALPTPRNGFDAVVINDEIYVIGGNDADNYLTANEKFTPDGYIPEFPSWAILPLALTATAIAVIYRKRLIKSCSSILGD
jgi:N-acetylneuraminic acid mutarotase